MAVQLRDYQLEAVNNLKNGSILCGGVGSGKSRTALAYYFEKVCLGKITSEPTRVPLFPKDLYIITTAKNRDSLEWEDECSHFCLSTNPDTSLLHIKVVIDSWNNIKKYTKVYGAFFIFDEQRVVGRGAWVKAFLKITRMNQWILASATPGDKWEDYIPVFIANGFYRNKTEFTTRHIVFRRYTKYPKVDRYLDQQLLMRHRKEILITMKDKRETHRNKIYVPVSYNIGTYKMVMRERWDPYKAEPIKTAGELCYLMRQIVNSDPSRIDAVHDILAEHPRAIIFYNFDYELLDL